MQLKISRPGLVACALLASTCLALAASRPAQAQSFNIQYRVSLLGLTVGKASMSGSFASAGYHMRADAKLAGLAALMSKGSGAVTSHGAIRSGVLYPDAYATISVNPRTTRTIRMSMKDRGVEGVDVSPPFNPAPDRVPVTAQMKRDVVDPLSAAILTSSDSGNKLGADICQKTLPIFDGVVRFNIVLSYKATREVKMHGYRGPVQVCAARYVPIAGHRPQRRETQFMINNKNIEVWLAPLLGTNIALPVRISVGTEVGTVDINAHSFVRN
ncbi:MAG: DUF3108 domain-containing protein [Hyphomicrobiales bacterium]|nr:DUF3108 domain-containing protein [Hyphomicrobiales bacterium]MDE2113899.1 DUF3108 domain-containing protein [Hyphomicrobiales bacterium]